MMVAEKNIKKNIKEVLSRYPEYILPSFFSLKGISLKEAKENIRHPLRIDKMFQITLITDEYIEAFRVTREYDDPKQSANYQVILTLEVQVYQGIMEAYANFKTQFPSFIIEEIFRYEAENAVNYSEARKENPFYYYYENIEQIEWEDMYQRLTATFFLLFACYFFANSPTYFDAVVKLLSFPNAPLFHNGVAFHEIEEQVKKRSRDALSMYGAIEDEFNYLTRNELDLGGGPNYGISDAYSEPRQVRVIALLCINLFKRLSDKEAYFLSFDHLMESVKGKSSIRGNKEASHSKKLVLHKILQPLFTIGDFRLTSFQECIQDSDSSLKPGQRFPIEYTDKFKKEIDRLLGLNRKKFLKKNP